MPGASRALPVWTVSPGGQAGVSAPFVALCLARGTQTIDLFQLSCRCNKGDWAHLGQVRQWKHGRQNKRTVFLRSASYLVRGGAENNKGETCG